MKTINNTKPPHLALRERGSAHMPRPGSDRALLGHTEAGGKASLPNARLALAASPRPAQSHEPTPAVLTGAAEARARLPAASPGPSARRLHTARQARASAAGTQRAERGSGAPPGSRRGEARVRRKRPSRRATEGSPPGGLAAYTYGLVSSAL